MKILLKVDQKKNKYIKFIEKLIIINLISFIFFIKKYK